MFDFSNLPNHAEKNFVELLDRAVVEPVSVAEMDCFAVFVSYPEMPFGTECKNSSGLVLFNAVGAAGLMGRSNPQTMDVISGNGRVFTLIGFKKDGALLPACPYLPFTYSSYSAALSRGYVLATKMVNLLPGNQEISLTTNFNANNYISSCSGSLFQMTLTSSPPAINNLKLWLDASDTSTHFSNDGCSTLVSDTATPVKCWKNKIIATLPNALNATANAPLVSNTTYNGVTKKSLVFDGTKYLSIADHADFNSSTYSIAIFFAPSTIDASVHFLLDKSDVSNRHIQLYSGASNTILYATGTSSNSVFSYSANTLAVQGPELFVITFNSATSQKMYRRSGPYDEEVSDTPFAIEYTTSPLYIGQSVSSSDKFSGQIYEVLYFNTELTSAQVNELEAYIESKWSVNL